MQSIRVEKGYILEGDQGRHAFWFKLRDIFKAMEIQTSLGGFQGFNAWNEKRRVDKESFLTSAG
jgi:hypothetical protein